jgi:hypothetical protein
MGSGPSFGFGPIDGLSSLFHDFQVMPVNIAIATLLVVFTLLDLTLKEGTLSFDKRMMA